MATRTTSDLDSVSNHIDLTLTENCKLYFDFTHPSCENYFPQFNNPLAAELVYESDLNLVLLHQIVKDRIYSLIRSVSIDEVKLGVINLEMSFSYITPIDHRFNLVKIKEINSRIDNILKSNYWDRYCKAVIPILNKYVEIMSNEFKGNISSGCNVSVDESKISERLKYIEKYIDAIIDLNILKVKITRKNKVENLCPGCLKSFDSSNSSTDEGRFSCKCGFTDNNISHSTEYSDLNKLAPQVTGNSKHIKTFTDWLDKFLCRSGDSYPQEEMFRKFDEFSLRNNYPNRYYVLSGLISQPDLSVIISLLQNHQYSHYYTIKNTIRRDYFGWKVPEITSLQESKALELYLNIQEKFPEFRGDERKTNINGEIIGYTVLIMVGVAISSSDFKIPINSDTRAYSKDTLFNILLSLGYDRMSIPEMDY